MLHSISKALIHFINGSALVTNNEIIVDVDAPITIFGGNWTVAGLTDTLLLTYPTGLDDGEIKQGLFPVSCTEVCDKDTWKQLAPDSNKTGLMFFDRVSARPPVVTCEAAKCIETIRLISWYDRCKLGFEECCYAYPVLMNYIYQNIPVDRMLKFKDPYCEEMEVDVYFKIVGKSYLDNKTFVKWAYDKSFTDFINVPPYESFTIDIEVTYTSYLQGECAVILPEFPEPTECICLF